MLSLAGRPDVRALGFDLEPGICLDRRAQHRIRLRQQMSGIARSIADQMRRARHRSDRQALQIVIALGLLQRPAHARLA